MNGALSSAQFGSNVYVPQTISHTSNSAHPQTINVPDTNTPGLLRPIGVNQGDSVSTPTANSAAPSPKPTEF